MRRGEAAIITTWTGEHVDLLRPEAALRDGLIHIDDVAAGLVRAALFQADAGRWKLTAMQTVKAWLAQQIKTSSVDAINGMAVIA